MSGTLNPTRLRHAIVAAGAEPDLDLQDAITTAYEWHPGGGSALYAFASNGGNLADEAQRQQLLTEVEESIAWVTQNAPQIDAGKLPEYTEDAEEASEQGMTTSQLQLKRLNNLKAVAAQAVIVKEASLKEAAIGDAPGEAEARELELYAENTGSLYPQKLDIIKNLQKKMDKGVYDPGLAWRLWLYWVDRAAQQYAKEHGGVWFQLFPKTVRTQVAKSISADEEERIRTGEYRETPKPLAAPVQASSEKEAKTLISADVFRRAVTECNDLLGAVAGSGSDLEGKLTKIQHELNKLEAGAGGNLEFILDDEASPSTAKWARELIRALSTLKAQMPQAPAAAPVGVQASVDKEAFGFTEQTARAIIQFCRTHKDQLASMMNNRSQGPAAVLQALQKVPGGANMGGKLLPALQQWLTGAATDSAFAGMVEHLFTRKSATWDPQEAMHIASGALLLAGFKPSEVSAKGSTVTVAGLRVNPHVLRHTAKLASDYGFQVKLQTPRRKKALTQPTPEEQPAPGAPVPPSAAGNHAGPSNPTNPTGVNPAQTAQQPAAAPAPAPSPVKTYGVPSESTPLAYGQKAGALVLAAGEQGDLGAAVESAYEWHSGQSSYLYSFASLGGVLYKESWRGGLENEVESAIEAVQKKPDAYDPDEMDKLQNLLLVVSTIPAKTNDEEPEPGVTAPKQAADSSLVATLAEAESMLTSVQELADKAVGVARLANNPTLVTNVERLAVKVYESLMACRTAKADAQTTVKVPDSVAPIVGLAPVAASRRRAAVEFFAKELEAGDIFSVPGQPMVYRAQAAAPSPNNPSIILVQAETKTGEVTTLRLASTSKLHLGSHVEFQAGTPMAVSAARTASGTSVEGETCYGCGDAPASRLVKGVPLCEECTAEFTAGPVKGKCDYCGAPVPPELAEENVCSGCARMLGSGSFGEDEAMGKPYDMVMASLHLAAAPSVFTQEEANSWLETIKSQIQAPFLNGYVSTLGGADRPSIMLTVSADPEASWPNHILENSTYAKLSINYDGTLEVFSGYVRRGNGQPGRISFRKTKVTGLVQALARIQALVSYLQKEKAPEGKQAADQLDRGPDATQGDTVENAIEWINANGKDLDDKTVQQLRDALQAAGYTQQVADEAVTELLGQEALQALATPVEALLGS